MRINLQQSIAPLTMLLMGTSKESYNLINYDKTSYAETSRIVPIMDLLSFLALIDHELQKRINTKTNNCVISSVLTQNTYSNAEFRELFNAFECNGNDFDLTKTDVIKMLVTKNINSGAYGSQLNFEQLCLRNQLKTSCIQSKEFYLGTGVKCYAYIESEKDWAKYRDESLELLYSVFAQNPELRNLISKSDFYSAVYFALRNFQLKNHLSW